MKRFYPAFFHAVFALLLISGLSAQTPSWQWATQQGRLLNESGKSIATDNSGHIYEAGIFFDSAVTFGTIHLHNFTSSGANCDMYVVKYDNLGNIIWAIRAGGNRDEDVESITTDASGNIFVTGSFSSATIVFGSTTLTNATTGAPDFFIVKYDPNGNVLWAKRAGGSVEEVGTCIRTDASGNSYVTGYYNSNSFTFGSTTLTNAGGTDIFMAKYDPSGNVVWAQGAGDSGDDVSLTVGLDNSGNIFLAGHYNSSSITFGSTTLVNATNSGWFGDVFLTKFDPSGNPLWAITGAGMDGDGAESVATDAAGNCYMVGTSNSTSLTFASTTINNPTGHSMFITKHNPSGVLQWVRNPVVSQGASSEDGNSIATDSVGNCYVTGNFRGNVTFGFTTISNSNMNNTNSDPFIAKYDASGNVYWAASADALGDNLSNEIAIDAAGNSYITGSFTSDTIWFGTSQLANGNTNSSRDIYTAKLDNSGSVVTATNTVLHSGNSVALYPNPSSGLIHLKISETDFSGISLEVYNAVGECVLRSPVLNSETDIDLRKNETGVYFYRVTNAGKLISSGKLVLAGE